MSCGYLGTDGLCTHEIICNRYHKRIKCQGKLFCNSYTDEKELIRKHNEKAHDRPFLENTELYIKKWYSEGMTVIGIAMMLNRSTDVIERVIKVWEKISSTSHRHSGLEVLKVRLRPS